MEGILEGPDDFRATAEISAVAAGRKPLFHEQFLPLLAASAIAEKLQESLPEGVFALAWGDPESAHLAVYDVSQVEYIIALDDDFYGSDVEAAVRSTCEEGQNGELLGYGVRNMADAGTSVRFRDSTGKVRAGFWASAEDFEVFVKERLQDYTDALDCDWLPESVPLKR